MRFDDPVAGTSQLVTTFDSRVAAPSTRCDADNRKPAGIDEMKMSIQEKKGRAGRVIGKSPIAAPPRVAVQGRSKADHHDDSASTKSTLDGNSSDIEDSELDVKDKRIAELEKEVATMEDEFERELTQLSHKMTNEKETAAFWQQKHSTLNQTFLKTDTDLRLLRQEVNSFQQTREERDRDVRLRISVVDQRHSLTLCSD
jgi:hypothetical protein